jgi:hypothetical protein
MPRGTETKGKLAAQLAGVDDVEIKATIPEAQIDLGLRRFKLTEANKNQRYVYFFDTPQLELFNAGLIARARRVPGGTHDTTIKVRPVKPDSVPAKWTKYRGFKIEADMSEKGVVPSASFTMPVQKGAIKRAVVDGGKVRRLFTGEQQDFFKEMAAKGLSLDNVHVMGPIDVWRWKVVDPGLPWPATVEYWQLDNGERTLEASIKVSTVQAAAGSGGFLAFLAEIGAERDRGEEAKTRWALTYFARQYVQPAVKKASAAKAAG